MRIAHTLVSPPRRSGASRPTASPAAPALLEMRELMRAGRKEDALRLALESLQEGRSAPLLELARATSRMGRGDLALTLLGLVGSTQPELLEDIAADRAFVSLRDDPRFMQITGRL